MEVWFRAKKAMVLLVPKIMQAITTFTKGTYGSLMIPPL
jgi:hypothetical protein